MSNVPAAVVVAREKKARQGRRRRWITSIGIVVGLLLFGFFGLPPIIRAQAMKRLSAELHREVTINKIRLNPLVLSITIEGLEIKDRDGGPFTSWKRLYVNFDSFSIFTGEWHFQEIDLEAFSQHVGIANDGTFNFADLIPAPSGVAAAPEEAPSKPRPIRVTKLKVHQAALAFSDASLAKPFATQAGPVSFELKNFLTAGAPKAPYEFSAITESGETFTWTGTMGIDPVRSSGSFKLGKVALKKYAPYYAPMINADLLDGLLDVAASYAVELDAEIKPVRLDLSDAKIALTNLKVAARDSTLALVDLPSFTIDGLSADGIKPSATIQRIALEGGLISVVREADGSINLLNLLPKPAESAAATSSATVAVAATPALLPDVKLAEFAIKSLAIDIEDRTTPTPAKNVIKSLDVIVRNVSLTEGAAPIALQADVAFAPSGTVAVQGSVTREPLTADLGVRVEALPLAGITPYVDPFLNLRIAGGTVSVDGKARLNGLVAGFTGDVAVNKFQTVDGKLGEDFVKFTRFSINGIDATSEPLAAKIDSIEIVDPLARVAVYADKSLNLDTILRKDVAPAQEETPAVAFTPPPAATASPASAPVWSLGKFTLTNGKVMVADSSVKPAARLALDQFNGTVTGLSSAAPERAHVDIHGKFNGTGSIAITGKLDARAITPVAGALTEVTIDVKGLDLSPISPYVGTYAGYELARSGLTVGVKTQLTQRKIKSENVIVLNQFTLGAPTNSPDATKLPVRLGVALLKDVDGNIEIDLPVNGSLDDPKFKVGRVVLNVLVNRLVNLLVKAASSPFSLIGAAFGGGGDDLAFQQFEAGTITPADVEAAKMDTLRKALKARPALNLDITGSYDAKADLDAVRMQTLDKQVRYRLWEELRSKDPHTPSMAELMVAPEDEARIIALFAVERFPGGLPADVSEVAVATPATAVVAPVVTKPEPPSRRRTQNVFSGRRPKAKSEPTPVVFAPVDNPAAGGEAGLPAPTLAEVRQLLAAAIPVSDHQLRALADERARAVRTALLEGGEIDEARLLLTLPAPEPAGARVLLQLR